MRKGLLLTMAIIITTLSYGQTTVTGMIGVHSSKTSTNLALGTDAGALLASKPITSLTGGIIVDHSLDNLLSFSTGVLARRKGFKVSAGTGIDLLGIDLGIGASAVTQVQYVEVPLMLKAHLGNSKTVQPYIGAGPSVSYATSGSIDTRVNAILSFNVSSTPLELSSPNFNRWQLGGNAVAGVKVPYGTGHWMVEGGYNTSFTDLISDDFLIDAGGKHSGWTLSVGYGMTF